MLAPVVFIGILFAVHYVQDVLPDTLLAAQTIKEVESQGAIVIQEGQSKMINGVSVSFDFFPIMGELEFTVDGENKTVVDRKTVVVGEKTYEVHAWGIENDAWAAFTEVQPEMDVTTTNTDSFDPLAYIPSGATLVQLYPVDLYGDGGRLEYVVHSHDDDVVSAAGKLVPKDYLDIFAWYDTTNTWTLAHKDEINTDMNEYSVTITRFTTSPRDYVLVEKLSLPHGYQTGYYVFGETKPGYIDELVIPKGYLHEEEYLEEGETQLYFRGVRATPEALVEYYDIACEAKEYTEPRFGDKAGDNLGPCRRLEISQTLIVDTDQTTEQNNSLASVTRNEIVE